MKEIRALLALAAVVTSWYSVVLFIGLAALIALVAYAIPEEYAEDYW